jgi:putative glycosyltransferase (TIGR04348 family)
MLEDRYRVIVQTQWDGSPCDAMLALHARKSAPSVASWTQRKPSRGLGVVLTGTDLYRDLPESAEAIASLDAATRIAVLQDDAPRLLEARWRRKTDVIFQSAPRISSRRKPRDRLDCVVVGHLRAEKDPLTLFAAVRKLPRSCAIRIRHFGAPLEPELGEAARALAGEDERYRYVGAVPRGLVRAAMAASHLLVHPSVVEGGANVVVEAITCGTSVLASRISGNVGMLGSDYPGYFEPRDAAGLANALMRAREEPAFLRELAAACRARRALFTPAAESRAVHRLVASLLA